MNTQKLNQEGYLEEINNRNKITLKIKQSMISLKSKRIIKRLILYIFLVGIAIIILLPLYAGVVSAFKNGVEIIITTPIELPHNPTLDPLFFAMESLQRPILNSILFSTIATVLSCLVGSVCGFVLSKLKFRGSNQIFLLLTIGIFLPYQAVIIPLFITVRDLGLYNSIWGMVFVHTIYGIPITTLLFRSYYENIPESLLNAAKTDGAGILTIYKRLIIPLSPLPFVVAAVFQFTSIYNDYLFALFLTTTSGFTPASLTLSNMAGGVNVAWNEVMASSLLYSLPVLLIFIFLGKYLMEGLMSGAIKG